MKDNNYDVNAQHEIDNHAHEIDNHAHHKGWNNYNLRKKKRCKVSR